MKNLLITSALALSLLVGLSAVAEDSELDGKAKTAPKMMIKKLDEKAKTVTTYKVETVPADLTDENLAKLPKDERKVKLDKFFAETAVEKNKVSEEKLEVAQASELDKDKSTPAHGWRYRGYYGGYYGGGFYGGYYGGRRAYYNAGWGYGGGAYYGGAYYGGGYYNNCGGDYYGGYGYGYGYASVSCVTTYPMYTAYYCN